jgi:hypothetical protein
MRTLLFLGAGRTNTEDLLDGCMMLPSSSADGLAHPHPPLYRPPPLPTIAPIIADSTKCFLLSQRAPKIPLSPPTQHAPKKLTPPYDDFTFSNLPSRLL